MRYLAIMAAVAAFAWGSIATAQAECAGVTHTVQSGTKDVASTSGSTPVVVPEPKSGS